jgi:hypothetical protein
VRQRFNVRRHWNKHWSEIEYWNVMRLNGDRWKRMALVLAAHSAPDDAVVAPGIGNLGYWSRLTILDQAGLVDRDVARRPVTGPTAPGHDRMVPAEFFLDREPRWIAPHLVEDGAELERTREWLSAEARRLHEAGGLTYDLAELPVDAGERGPVEAMDAVLANLFGERAAPPAGTTREVVAVLERSAP